MQKLKQFGFMTFSSLALYNYRLYFIGQTFSFIGTWMQQVAQTILLLQMHGNGTSLGFLIAVQFLPILLFGSLGGVLADRYSKRKLLFITQTLSGAMALLQAMFIYFNIIQFWQLYVFAFGLGLINALDSPTKQSFIFEMVGKSHIKNAVSLNSTLVNLARIFGPSLAALCIPLFGMAACFLINALSFLAVLIALLMMRPSELHSVKEIKKLNGQLREGLMYVKNTPTLLYVLIMVAIIGTLTFEFNVSLGLYAAFTFNNSLNGLAILYTALSIGAVLGGLYSASRKKTSVSAIIQSSLIFGSLMIISSSAPTLQIAALLMIPVGFYSIVFIALANSLLQMTSSAEMRGRVMSLWSMALLGSTPIGGPIIGYISQMTNPRMGLIVGGLATYVASAIVFFMMKRDKEQTISEAARIAHTQTLADKSVSMK